MIRIKITQPHKNYKVGDTILVTPNEAFDLLDRGVAIKTKEMLRTDYPTAKSLSGQVVIKKRGK